MESARKRAAELQGPPISFKRSRNRLHVDERGGLWRPTERPPPAERAKDAGQAAGGWNATADPHGLCPNVSSRYEKLGRIGEGTYGVVYRARDRRTGDDVALKRCLPHHEQSDGFPLTTLREIAALREISATGHPGIVKLMDVAVSSSRSGVFLVFEYCEHDLANLVDAHYASKGRSPFREGEVKSLAMQLLSAVSFLHSRHIIHRDIKLSNLLYNHRGELRLADFGLSRRVGGGRIRSDSPRREGNKEDKAAAGRSLLPLADPSLNNLTPKVVSLWYRPPEILLGSDEYDEGVDNWGVGCVIGELLEGVPLIKGKNEMDQIFKMFELLGSPNPSQWPCLTEMPLIKNGSISIPHRTPCSSSSASALLDRFDSISSAGIELLQNLLRYDCTARWSADRALESDFFGESPLPTPRELMPTFPTQHGA